jgi:DNA-binding NarL/FixJ family response regulator
LGGEFLGRVGLLDSRHTFKKFSPENVQESFGMWRETAALAARSSFPNQGELIYDFSNRWRSRPEGSLAKTRVLIADDHTLVAEAFKRLLEPECEVVGTVGDGRALLKAAPQLQPDLVLVDLNMPLLNGLDASEQLKQSLPKIKIIVLTMNEDPEIAAETMDKWASGYLLKKSAGSELLKAVREVLHGGKYVTPALQEAIAEIVARDARSEPTRTLTPRQREVLQLLAEGHTMKEAAAILNVATRTVAFHKYRIMQDFGLENNSELLRFAMKQKLVNQT